MPRIPSTPNETLDPIVESDVVGFSTPSEEFDVSAFRHMVYSHAASTPFRLFRSWQDASGNPRTSSWGDGGRYVVEEENVAGKRILAAVVSASRQLREKLGTWEEGSIVVTYLPDEVSLDEGDEIMIWGIRPDGSDAPMLTHQEILKRGNVTTDLGVTASSAGGVVTFSGAVTTVIKGDLLVANGQGLIVNTVDSPTQVTCTTTPSPVLLGHDIARATDLLLMPGAAHINGIRKANGTRPIATEFRLEGNEVRWLDNTTAPAYLEQYAVRYAYWPRYVCRQSMKTTYGGNGEGLFPNQILAHLWVPDTHRV